MTFYLPPAGLRPTLTETWAQTFWETLTPNTDPAPFPALGGGWRAQLPWHLCSPPEAFTFFSPVFSSWPVSLPLKSSAPSPARLPACFLAVPPVWALSPTGLPDGLSLLTGPCSPAHGPSYTLALRGSRICRADQVPSQFKKFSVGSFMRAPYSLLLTGPSSSSSSSVP